MKTKRLNGNYNIIGSNIKKYRKQKGLSQRVLSDKLLLLGVNLYHTDISRIEMNGLAIRDYELQAICKVLNITLNQLFEDTDHYFS